MKILSFLILTIVVLLSIAAGLAKVMQTQQEMEFLQGFGLSPAPIVTFGLVQIIGGNLVFGLFSILPIGLAGVVIYQCARTTHNNSITQNTSDTGAS